jgi:serine/threonine-protein kinase ATR
MSPKSNEVTVDIRQLINHGIKLTDMLLHACEYTVEGRATHASLHRNLGFKHSVAAPCKLVVPVEATLTVTLPTVHTSLNVKMHKAFPASRSITIESFDDDVLVLSSLQRPRKLTVRGSNGQKYGLLCKPKDDLRKDQRLMEFNSEIGRALKRDVESRKRRLYIHTYAVTPLNEECGTIEWVDGLKALRDIIMSLYQHKNIPINYSEIRKIYGRMQDDGNIGLWNELLQMYPPILHEWFVETFPDPEAWLTARLRYTRSCAVTSIVGHILGLGDRHGENVNLEEGNGGVFHVDFNCLFDKGLTFERPEVVPFRLTDNMVDAFGAYGVEGPFRVAAELALKTCRNDITTLMTILETFLYDPTADFVSKKKRPHPFVPDTPQAVLESVKNKLKGYLQSEAMPLGVEGYVDHLIREARNPELLAQMYIGWCAYF